MVPKPMLWVLDVIVSMQCVAFVVFKSLFARVFVGTLFSLMFFQCDFQALANNGRSKEEDIQFDFLCTHIF
jgi:hypothetical protein